MRKEVILASASRRRSAILSSCGIRHKVSASGIKEAHDLKLPPSRLVVINAKNKANHIAARYKNSIIIGADTLVRQGNRLIGKPLNAKEAKGLLKLFSNKKAEVFTGIYLIDTSTKKVASGYEKSIIFAEKISANDIGRFFKLLGPYDKAGGFSIEGVGSLIFDNIKGSYFNILGLPMVKLAKLFKKLGFDISSFITPPRN